MMKLETDDFIVYALVTLFFIMTLAQLFGEVANLDDLTSFIGYIIAFFFGNKMARGAKNGQH